MSVFYCDACRARFEAEGARTEWIDRTYGPCTRWTAICPTCGAECRLAETVHAHSENDSFGGSLGWGGGSCDGGGSGCSSCGGN
jgi:hypothetical protein